jgi:hypothetical protein
MFFPKSQPPRNSRGFPKSGINSSGGGQPNHRRPQKQAIKTSRGHSHLVSIPKKAIKSGRQNHTQQVIHLVSKTQKENVAFVVPAKKRKGRKMRDIVQISRWGTHLCRMDKKGFHWSFLKLCRGVKKSNVQLKFLILNMVKYFI